MSYGHKSSLGGAGAAFNTTDVGTNTGTHCAFNCMANCVSTATWTEGHMIWNEPDISLVDPEKGNFDIRKGSIAYTEQCGHLPGPASPGLHRKLWFHKVTKTVPLSVRGWGESESIWTFTGTAVGGFTIEWTVRATVSAGKAPSSWE